MVKAIVCREHGGLDTLEPREIDLPAPGPGQLRIRVRACGVNFPDTLQIAGTYQTRTDPPFVPGQEVAGDIVACGPGVEGFAPGDRVLAATGIGGYAEEVVAEAGWATPMPEAMDYVTGAGFAITYGTSHLALKHRAALQPGENLLVTGAGGGVGVTAVEIGKLLGARVIAAARGTRKLALARELGADETVDYEAEDLRVRVKELTGGAGADVIYDPVGGDVFDACMRCIAWEGRILVIGFASGRIPSARMNIVLVKNIALLGFAWSTYRTFRPELFRASCDELLRWYEAGRLRCHVSATYPLADAARALADLTARRTAGKVVLVTDG